MKKYILFDDRASDPLAGTVDAAVLVVCDDKKEALDYRGDFGGMACYSYDDEGGQLTNEQFEWNWFPGNPITGPWPK
jgi:hypothetical protein